MLPFFAAAGFVFRTLFYLVTLAFFRSGTGELVFLQILQVFLRSLVGLFLFGSWRLGRQGFEIGQQVSLQNAGSVFKILFVLLFQKFFVRFVGKVIFAVTGGRTGIHVVGWQLEIILVL